MRLKISKPLLLGGIVFVGGILAVQFNIVESELICNRSKFQYINKKLSCDGELKVAKYGYAGLKRNLQDLIQEKTKEGTISEASVYFRDLHNGPTLGINEHIGFAPASLLKVPLMLAYLKLAEEKPRVLEEKLTYQLMQDTYNPFFPPKDPIKEGGIYTVNDLLTHMIKYSDNQAYFVLFTYLKQISPQGQDLFTETYWDLGIVDPQNPLADAVTVKAYASIFVQLYNATLFDSREISEKALALLADADFDSGIRAGVPTEIKMAHKFGERESKNNQKQLQDCGIVYYPENPYLICVMTRGKDINKLTEVIGLISKMAYEEFDSRKL